MPLFNQVLPTRAKQSCDVSRNSSSSAHSVFFSTSAYVNKHKWLDFQVVLHDILSQSSTKNFQTLKFNLDKTNSADSHQT